MEKLKIFYLEGCPYCRKAADALKQLQAENSAYETAQIEWIEESRSPAIANRYDYYYVPSVYCGEDKLYECSPKDDYDTIKRQLEAALQKATAK